MHTPAIERAYAASSALVMELDFDDFDSAAVSEMMATRATDAGGLVESLGEEGYERAAERAARLGLDIEPLRATEPWFAALSITDMALAQLGFGSEHGVEAHFTSRARAGRQADRRTGDGGVPDRTAGRDAGGRSSASCCSSPSRRRSSSRELLDKLLGAWRSGDEHALRAGLETSFDPFPDLYRSLIVDRNERWMPAIDALLAGPTDNLVIVGALHLIGEHSVIRLLEQRGYRVQRL